MIVDGEKLIDAHRIWYYAIYEAQDHTTPSHMNAVLISVLSLYAVWRRSVSNRVNKSYFN